MRADRLARRSWEDRAGWFSTVLFRWPSPLVDTGLKRALTLDDALVPPAYDQIERAHPAFLEAYARRESHPERLARALYDVFRRRFWVASLIFLAYQVLSAAAPLLILVLVSSFGRNGSAPQGLLIALGLGAFQILESIAHKHQWSEVWKTAQSVTALLRVEVLRKYVRMDGQARAAHPTGEVLTLTSSDAMRVGQTAFVHMAWAVPFGIASSAVLLCVLLGWAGLVGIAVLVLGLYLANKVNDRVFALVPEIRAVNGVRIGLVADYVAAVRTLRSHGWEEVAERAVGRERDALNRLLVTRQRRLATLYLVNAAAPVLMLTVTLLVFIALGNRLEAPKVFAAVAVLSGLRQQLPELVRFLDMRNDWRVALDKLTTFLDARESVFLARSSGGEVSLSGASFAWPGQSDARLGPLDLTVAPGEFVCILGRVGSGKSSLLAALAGAMPLVDGEVHSPASVVYMPQNAWVMQATVAENVTCFSEPDPARYAQVIDAVGLDTDIALMPLREATVLADRGANLSGGQRQRLSLARAAYEQAEVYLLDDPTSAVDDGVAATIRDRLLCGLLADRTRVVATHRLDLARLADRVVVLDQGRVVAFGPFEEVTRSTPGLLTGVARPAGLVEEANPTPEVAAEPEPSDKPQLRGGIAGSTYRRYFSVLTPGRLLVVLLGLALLAAAFLNGSSLWLGYWTERPDRDTVLYALVFAGLGLTSLGMDRALFAFAFTRGVATGQQVHRQMLTRVLHSPLEFFDHNPSGRVLTRFSSDMESVDLELPRHTIDLVRVVVGFAVPALALAALGPATIVLIVLVVLAYLRLQRRTRSSTVAVSRLAKAAREPVTSMLTEVIEGVTSIQGRPARMAGYEHSFIERVRTAQHADYTVNSLSRYFNIRLDVLSGLVLSGAAAVLVVQDVGPGVAGAGLTFAYALVGSLSMGLLGLRMMDLSLASFERIDAYTRLPTEPRDGAAAPAGWPDRGVVRFEGVVMRYRPDAPPALDDVSFEIPGGSKVGIVGRTGSGKSSLFATLLRFVEAESGTVTIDGLDIASLRLEDLRAEVVVVPQDPVLLPGTLRENLDPFYRFSDAQVVEALEKIGLGCRFGADTSMLENVPINGTTFSAGERQLVCLARAILHRARVVLIDEATSSLDAQTDELIQRTLGTELADATVLCIAHRRSTLDDADLVLTLDGGRVADIAANAMTS